MGWVTVAFLVWGSLLGAHDIRWRRLPDQWTVGGGAVMLVVATVLGETTCAFIGAGLWFSAYLMLGCCGAVGGGDVKFSIGLGAWIGWMCADHTVYAVVTAIVLASLFSAFVGILARLRTVPHGPSMLAGAIVVAMFFGPGIPWEVFA